VTRRAGRRCVNACQRELRLGVIEDGSGPRYSRMAGNAVLRKAGRCVIRIGRVLVVRQVTRNAISRSAGELAIQVTLCTSHVGVSPREREAGCGVIELGAGPLHSVVARLAGRRKSG
jgi:hypothetical protein